MQPGVTTTSLAKYPLAQPILMDRFAAKATNVPPKVINLIIIVTAPAQATRNLPRKSANIQKKLRIYGTRARCLDCSIRFSQNSRLLSPQGLFISSIDHQ
jgi:hypothetical protein